MQAGPQSSTESIHRSLKPALPGLLFALLTILYGFGLGILFGLNEDLIKLRLAASAEAVRDVRYQGDQAAIDAVLEKSWTYMKRAHLHAGGLGTSAIALTLLVVLLGTPSRWTFAISLALGVGGLGYSVYWLVAGFRAPGMGGTSIAKESLAWLAMPSSGLVVSGTAATVVLMLTKIFSKNARAGRSLDG